MTMRLLRIRMRMRWLNKRAWIWHNVILVPENVSVFVLVVVHIGIMSFLGYVVWIQIINSLRADKYCSSVASRFAGAAAKRHKSSSSLVVIKIRTKWWPNKKEKKKRETMRLWDDEDGMRWKGFEDSGGPAGKDHQLDQRLDDDRRRRTTRERDIYI